MLIIITQSPNTMDAIKIITTGKPTTPSTKKWSDFTIESGLRPILQDKDPHIDELNEDKEDQMSECEECGDLQELGTFNVAESKNHNTQHAFCDDCFAKYIERGEIRKVWGEEEWELLDQNDDDYDEEPFFKTEEEECDELNAAIDASGNCFH